MTTDSLTAPLTRGELFDKQRQDKSLGRAGDPTVGPMKPREYIASLASRFPSLNPVTPGGWDVQSFVEGHEKCSPGPYMAALFVAQVWNPGWAKDNLPAFDLMLAVSSWDGAHRAAFTTWAASPCWP